MTFTQERSLIEIGEPLSATTFVVFDLETTGTSPHECGITEIGAVKVRGGEVLGEFQTLVNPGSAISPIVVRLTGITDAMVVNAPSIGEVLPSFLEFLGDSVLVAHNARFDVSFLRAACSKHGYAAPHNEVVDTLLLAQRTVTKEEAPNRKLSTLARIFGTTVTPDHRALSDARATSEIMFRMLERLAAFGVTHREDLASLKSTVPARIRSKARIADTVPTQPGVYIFRGPQGDPLYVGTSRDLRSRVKQYFTRAETRTRVKAMVELATTVDTIVCESALEAAVHEVRLIHQWQPQFNVRSKHRERTPWIRLSDEPHPRLVVNYGTTRRQGSLGPFRSTAEARIAIEALHEALGTRTCTTRLPLTPSPQARACVLKDMGACSAPCVAGNETGYDSAVSLTRAALDQNIARVVAPIASTVARYSQAEDYERAIESRDKLSIVVDAAHRADRLLSLQSCSIIAVRPDEDGWELASVAHGRLTGAARVKTGVWAAADALREARDEAVHTDPEDADAALIEEQEIVLSWLEKPGTRLLYVDGTWSSPATGAGQHLAWVEARRQDRTHRMLWNNE
ncbi:DEDD exonuclease domain-containing protein [Demequina sediminicola]|uniref:DEDD exonuclease domain-containing protein n=1 Tax=Demequina sediminicola TaxID=1095026 RepID=UPI00137915F5|nr:DEDD exonuclease domain-containing protein [Demequina sediminicola]